MIGDDSELMALFVFFYADFLVEILVRVDLNDSLEVFFGDIYIIARFVDETEHSIDEQILQLEEVLFSEDLEALHETG